jgi:hypothetical protein
LRQRLAELVVEFLDDGVEPMRPVEPTSATRSRISNKIVLKFTSPPSRLRRRVGFRELLVSRADT